MKNVIFTICGRAGSKGAPNKNVRSFCGQRIVYFTLAVVRMFQEKHHDEYEHLDIALSTDSESLIEMVQTPCPDVFCLRRDASLAGDLVRKIDVIRDAYRHAITHFGRDYDVVVDLDLTSPLRTLQDLESMMEKRSGSRADVIYTVVESRRNPYFNMVCKKGEWYDRVLSSSFATRQEAPAIFDMNASIYAYSHDFMHSENPYFDRSDILITKDTGVLDIDSDEDFVLLQVIAEAFFKTDSQYAAIYERAKQFG